MTTSRSWFQRQRRGKGPNTHLSTSILRGTWMMESHKLLKSWSLQKYWDSEMQHLICQWYRSMLEVQSVWILPSQLNQWWHFTIQQSHRSQICPSKALRSTIVYHTLLSIHLLPSAQLFQQSMTNRIWWALYNCQWMPHLTNSPSSTNWRDWRRT